MECCQLSRDVVRADGLEVRQSRLVDVGHAVAAALAEAHLGDGVEVEAVAADVELTGAPVKHVVLAARQIVFRLGPDGLVHLVSVLLPVKQSLGVQAGGAQYEPPQRLHPGDSPHQLLTARPLSRPLQPRLLGLVGGDRVLQPLTALHRPQLVQPSAHPSAP